MPVSFNGYSKFSTGSSDILQTVVSERHKDSVKSILTLFDSQDKNLTFKTVEPPKWKKFLFSAKNKLYINGKKIRFTSKNLSFLVEAQNFLDNLAKTPNFMFKPNNMNLDASYLASKEITNEVNIKDISNFKNTAKKMANSIEKNILKLIFGIKLK